MRGNRARATPPRKTRPSPWVHLKHPFRILYLGILFLAANLVAALAQVILTPSSGKPPDLQDTYVWRVAEDHPAAFWGIVGACVVLAALGWLFRSQSDQDADPRQTLPPARDLKAATFKLGDDVAAQAPYVISPVQEIFLSAVNVLHDSSVRAPGAKGGLLVMGVANAGKTRLAFEVVRKALPAWKAFIWRVDDVEPARDLFVGESIVVFIDDLQEHAPSEVRYSRGTSQTLDTRALALQKMVQDVRGAARHVIVVATCRTEDEVRTRARMGWLFAELAQVEVPLFPLQGPQAETIISEFREQALRRITDWDGTLGSLVLGLSAKRQSYAELVIERDPATRVLQAMKLLMLAGIEKHSQQRLQAICSAVFFRGDLGRDDIWSDTVENLIRMQFVTEGVDEGTLVIRKDAYFDQVITDYPAHDRPMQLVRDLEKALAALVDLRDVEAMFHLGNAFYRMKQYSQSLDAYDRVLDLAIFSDVVPAAVVWRNKGAVLQSQKRYRDAMAAYDKALQLNPRFASAWRNLGDIQLELGHDDEALDAYNHALDIDPRYTAALNSKGRALNKMGRKEEALTVIEDALQLDPSYDFAWRIKGDTLSDLHRREDALAAYDRALALNAKYAYAWNGKGVVFREAGRLNDALTAFDTALALDPALSYGWNGRGATLRDLGRNDEALAALDHALQLTPAYSSALKNRGVVLERLGRYDEALIAYDAAISVDARYAAARSGRASVLSALGRLEEALDEFDRALAGDPSYANALLGKAQVLDKLGKKELAAQVRASAAAVQASGEVPERQETVQEQRDQEQVSQ